MSDVSPLSGISGLSFDCTLQSPLVFFCLVLVLFLSYLFLPAGPFCWTFSRKFFQYFSSRERFFLHGSCLAARRSKWVCGMCSILPDGTGICFYAFFLYFLKNLVLRSQQNGPRYQRVLALCAFLTGANTEGTDFSKVLCLMFVYVLLYVNLCLGWFYGIWGGFYSLMTCVKSKLETDWRLLWP